MVFFCSKTEAKASNRHVELAKVQLGIQSLAFSMFFFSTFSNFFFHGRLICRSKSPGPSLCKRPNTRCRCNKSQPQEGKKQNINTRIPSKIIFKKKRQQRYGSPLQPHHLLASWARRPHAGIHH